MKLKTALLSLLLTTLQIPTYASTGDGKAGTLTVAPAACSLADLKKTWEKAYGPDALRDFDWALKSGAVASCSVKKAYVDSYGINFDAFDGACTKEGFVDFVARATVEGQTSQMIRATILRQCMKNKFGPGGAGRVQVGEVHTDAATEEATAAF